MNNTTTGSIIRNVYVSTRVRDPPKYMSSAAVARGETPLTTPSDSTFVVDMPVVLSKVYAVRVRNFKYTPEPIINNYNMRFGFVANGGAVTGTIQLDKGDYNQNIADLLDGINTYLNAYDVAFTLDPVSQLVQLTFSGSFITDYFEIAYCPILQMLGFENGVHLYRSSSPPPPETTTGTMIGYNTVAIASIPYKIINDTDLVLKIADVEAISSTDIVYNRATAVLMSSRSPNGVAHHLQDTPYPLLQVQHRLKQLRVTILNSDGNPYDFNSEDASFMIEFHCYTTI